VVRGTNHNPKTVGEAHKTTTIEQVGKRLNATEAALYKGFLNNDRRLKELERKVDKIHRCLISPSGRTSHDRATNP